MLNVDYSMLTGELSVLPPPLQSESGLTLFAGNVYASHAGAMIPLLLGEEYVARHSVGPDGCWCCGLCSQGLK